MTFVAVLAFATPMMVAESFFLDDVHRLLNLRIADKSFDLDDIYERLQPLLDLERIERLKKHRPVHFKTINIPLVNRAYPCL
jgi:hypothetical protein